MEKRTLILGVIGGVSWHSSAEYYKQLNACVAQLFGRKQSARLVLSSINFSDLLEWQKDTSQQLLRKSILSEGQRLKNAGCHAFVIASHTLSWLGQFIEEEVGLMHICLYKAVHEHLHTLNARTIGLIGTRYTMAESSFIGRYGEAGFNVVTPSEPLRTQIAEIVYKELVQGVFRKESEDILHAGSQDMAARGVDAVVLGCTEIGLLLKKRALHIRSAETVRRVPLVDLIEVHVGACLNWMKEHSSSLK